MSLLIESCERISELIDKEEKTFNKILCKNVINWNDYVGQWGWRRWYILINKQDLCIFFSLKIKQINNNTFIL